MLVGLDAAHLTFGRRSGRARSFADGCQQLVRDGSPHCRVGADEVRSELGNVLAFLARQRSEDAPDCGSGARDRRILSIVKDPFRCAAHGRVSCVAIGGRGVARITDDLAHRVSQVGKRRRRR